MVRVLLAQILGLAVVLSASGAEDRAKPAPPKKTYFPADRPVAFQDLVGLYRKVSYGKIADRIEKAAAPCLRLAPIREKVQIRTPHSKLGGIPDLPDEKLWPAWTNGPMSFLAQIHLAEIPTNAILPALPAQGMLYFFYDAEQSTWGFAPGDRGSWRVVYAEKVPETRVVTRFPKSLAKEAQFPTRFVRLVPDVSLDSLPDLPEDTWTEAQQDQIQDIMYEFVERQRPQHQMWGLPCPQQSDRASMALQCQWASHGIDCGNANTAKDPRADSLRKGAGDWILLLQIDSDEAADMMWGDGGTLYFWIRQQDLKERKFDNVWMVLECG